MFMLNSIRFTLTTGALVRLLAGCAVGPQYQRPSADVPKAFKEATLSPEAAQRWKAAQPSDDIVRGTWWVVFNDAQLDALQEQAVAANQDLKAAAARVTQARALQSGARDLKSVVVGEVCRDVL